MTTRLSMQGIRKRFGPTVALDGVDLEVRAGEIHGLVGENGAGKSTLMKILAGALAPDGGAVWLDGDSYQPRTPADGRGLGVSMIYQELSLASHLTVAENIVLGRWPRRGPFINRRRMGEEARIALARVGRPDIDRRAITGRLSIAERQVVEIARAVASDSRVLVLDEPTSSLGPDDTARVFALLSELRNQGLSIIYISHFLDEISALTDRFTVLRDGRTVQVGDTGATPMEQIVTSMVGRPVSDLYPRTWGRPGETLLEVESVDRSTVDAPLQVRRGEVLGIGGLMGSGRTEWLRRVFGLDPGGESISVLQKALRPGPSSSWSVGMGLLSEDRQGEGLALRLSIADNVALPRLKQCVRAGFLTRREVHRRVVPYLERLAVKARGPDARADSLSGGHQQKVALARLLFADCEIFLLDEPTRGIDVGAKAEIYRIIDQLAHTGDPSQRKAFVLISSYLPELLGLSDRVAVMCRGRLGTPIPAGQWTERSFLEAAVGAASGPPASMGEQA